MHKNLPTVEGLKTRFLCSITADEGTNTTLAGYVKVGGESLPMIAGGENELVAPATPAGDYLYELRAGGTVVLWGHLCARPSAFPPAEDVTDIEVTATITGETAIAVSITLKEGPQGPKGEPGDTGAMGPQGPQGEPLTYDDLTAEQRQELVEPLVMESAMQSPAGTTEDNANSYGFACVVLRSGKISQIDIECRHSGAVSPAGVPLYVKVWTEAGELLACSTNACEHEIAATLAYTFEPFAVSAGDELRITYHEEDTLESTTYRVDVITCQRVVSLENGETGGLLNSGGGFSSRAWVPKYTLHMEAERFAPAEHTADTTAHLTETEHSGLTELLANKDALLALLS